MWKYKGRLLQFGSTVFSWRNISIPASIICTFVWQPRLCSPILIACSSVLFVQPNDLLAILIKSRAVKTCANPFIYSLSLHTFSVLHQPRPCSLKCQMIGCSTLQHGFRLLLDTRNSLFNCTRTLYLEITCKVNEDERNDSRLGVCTLLLCGFPHLNWLRKRQK